MTRNGLIHGRPITTQSPAITAPPELISSSALACISIHPIKLREFEMEKSQESLPLIQPGVLAASSCSAAVARIITHPLDTIRLRIQTQTGRARTPIRKLIPTSFSAMYAGLPVALLFSVPALSIYLSSYELAKRIWTPILIDSTHSTPTMLQQFPAYMLSGLSAEIVSGWVWTPMEVTKSRLQKGKEGTSGLQLIRKIVRTEGLRGIWRGYTVALAVYGPYTAFYWPIYERSKALLIPGYDPTKGIVNSIGSSPESKSKSLFDSLTVRYSCCAAISCAFSAGLTHPIAVIQSAVQISGGISASTGSSPNLKTGPIKSAVNQLYKDGGFRSFSRGAVARMVYMVPSNVLAMATYELLKTHFGV